MRTRWLSLIVVLALGCGTVGVAEASEPSPPVTDDAMTDDTMTDDPVVGGDTWGPVDEPVADPTAAPFARKVERVGTRTDGYPSISTDGRYVAYVGKPANTPAQVYVRDRKTGLQQLASRTPAGKPGNGASGEPRITPDGRYVVFSSLASNLVTGDTNGVTDIFLRDLTTGAITLLSRYANGRQAANHSFMPDISDDGKLVAFWTYEDFATSDTNGDLDVYLLTRATKALRPLSNFGGGVFGEAALAISGDGRTVFYAYHYFVMPGGTHTVSVDVATGTSRSERVPGVCDVPDDCGHPDLNTSTVFLDVSRDGRFMLAATNARVPGDANGRWDVVLLDRTTRTWSLVSVGPNGEKGNGDSSAGTISADGRWVAFSSYATNFTTGDTNGAADIFLRDRLSRSMLRVSTDATGNPTNAASSTPDVSDDARVVAYQSLASNLVPGDTPNTQDLFAWQAAGIAAEVIKDTTLVTGGDVRIANRLKQAGWVVRVVDDNTLPTAATRTALAGSDLVVVTSSVNPALTTYTAALKLLSKPIVLAEAKLGDDLGLITNAANQGELTGQTKTQLRVTHPLGANLPPGQYTVTTWSTTLNWWTPVTSATVVATQPATTKAELFGIPKAGAIVGGAAPARRVGFFFADPTPPYATPTAWQLFQAAIDWAVTST